MCSMGGRSTRHESAQGGVVPVGPRGLRDQMRDRGLSCGLCPRRGGQEDTEGSAGTAWLGNRDLRQQYWHLGRVRAAHRRGPRHHLAVLRMESIAIYNLVYSMHGVSRPALDSRSADLMSGAPASDPGEPGAPATGGV